MNDIYIYSEENLLEQLKRTDYNLGFYRVKFYTKNGQLVSEETATISDFYLYPSGGTLRDENMNIVLYNSKFDTYRGFKAPSNSPQGEAEGTV
ncbi:MAG: hypothetical protein NTX22_08935 [Ignavibacteriales bacterium]|nr:hypothetical protein [Ignavibacteriales bacterium]